MRICIIAPGSRGDVQPYVALGKGLRDAGNEVRLVTNRNYESLVTSYNLEFRPVEVDIQELVQQEKMREALEKGGLLTSMAKMAEEMKRGAVHLAERGLEACAGMDMVLAGISGLFVGLSLAEKTGLPFLQAYNVPLTPTRAFPGALFPWLSSRLGGGLNILSHHLTRQVVWQAFRPADRLVRQEVLELPGTPFRGPFGSDRLRHAPVLYGFSPSVIASPPDWNNEYIHVTGYWHLDPPGDWIPPAALLEFLAAGPPPVSIGFGSMSSRKPEATANLVIGALGHARQRGIVFSGWSGMHKTDLPESVFMVDSVPHSWLFPRMNAVVHHGGAGTTAAGIRAGIPSVIVPFHGDQPFWGRRIADLGVGPEPIPRRKLTVGALAHAIQTALGDQAMRRRAAALGARVRSEDGISNAVAVVRELELRGTLHR